MIVLILLVILFLTILVKYILHMRHMESYVKHLPIRRPVYPFIGNAQHIFGKTTTQIFKEIMDFTKTFGTPYKSYIGPALLIILDKPDDLKTILTSNFCLSKPFVYQFYPSPAGILTVRSSRIWKPIRKMINPAFNAKILRSFIAIFSAKTDILLENMKKEIEQPISYNAKKGNESEFHHLPAVDCFNILPYMNACSLDMVSATTMGFNLDIQRNKNVKFLYGIEMLLEIIVNRFTSIWAQFNWIYRWSSMHKEEQIHLNNMHNLTNQVFAIKKEEYFSKITNKSQNKDIFDDSNESYKTPQALIDQLFGLLAVGKLNEQMIKEQIETVLMAGSETTALTLSYAVLMLAMHPKIQEQFVNELKTVFTDQNEEVRYKHLQELSYLDRILKEVMRLFPPAPIIARCVRADIPINNCTIPKNSIVMMSIFNMHRRPDIWGENADEFDPDNFLPERINAKHSFAYLPFSGGKRNCIGYQYALISMKVVLTKLFRCCKFRTDLKMKDLEFKFEVTLKLNNKHLVAIKRRTW